MESLDKSYLTFKADELYYLLDLSEVERIQDGKLEDGVTYLDFSKAVGGSACAEKKINKYIILLKNEEDGKDSAEDKEKLESDIREKKAGILVEQIIGIIEIENLKKILLKAPLINSRNEYLESIVQIQLETGEKWAYLLRSRMLMEAGFAQNIMEYNMMECNIMEPDKINQNLNKKIEKTGEDLWRPCITLLLGEKLLYIAKDKVEAVVIKPTIQRVPMAPEYVLGISVYKEEMVIYYNQSYTERKERSGKEAASKAKNPGEYTCGIIFKTHNGKLSGIAGDATGEVELCLEDRESLVTLGDGIWERKSD